MIVPDPVVQLEADLFDSDVPFSFEQDVQAEPVIVPQPLSPPPVVRSPQPPSPMPVVRSSVRSHDPPTQF